MSIKIPEEFCEKMEDEYLTECRKVYNKFQELMQREMYFFPEYTDHSYRHIEYVLETASNLIPRDTMEKLNKNDIFVLCLSILYHGLGMHITFASLKTLYNTEKEDLVSNRKFKKIWEAFVREKNMDNSLINLNNVKECQLEKDKYAEFIRVYHPLIASIIAENGFPIKDNEFLEYEEKIKKYLYRLSGIIARSHGENLREMVKLLQKEYGDMWKTPYDCHAVFLMCVVRIADYLHITNDRINPYRMNLRDFDSKKSETEYLKHKSVEYSQRIYDNPEVIYIEAQPENCKIYMEMLELLSGIQYELDTSWDVLGEVYGVSPYKLSIRRIMSNILDKKWRDSSQFVAEKLAFHFDIRLVDLLIEPLYGRSPSYGIRELIQNATDACKTRQMIGEEEYNPKVIIKIEVQEEKNEISGESKRKNIFSIEDNGIGMSLEVIRNHFLNIGSQFRNSDEWKKIQSGAKKEAKLNEKNGKFGIGILSSYMLGDVLRVTTKSALDKIQYKFATKRILLL